MSEEEYNRFKTYDLTTQLWKIYSLLSERSKEIISEHVSGVNLENLMVQTSYICKIGIVTEKAVGILNSDASKIAWIPKKAIKNLDKIVVIQGLTPEIIVHDWFAYKVKWVENKPPEDNRQ